MLETLAWVVGSTVAAVLGSLWFVAKTILPKAIELPIKRLEHSQNQEIKHLEARLQRDTTTLINSLGIASRIGESYRNRTVESVDKLWKDIVRIEKEFAPLVALETFLTESELTAAMVDPASCSSEAVRQILEEFSSFRKVADKLSAKAEKIDLKEEVALAMGTERSELDETRIFVSDRTWKMYCALVEVYGRLGVLVSTGMESGERAVHWKNDPHMGSIVAGTLVSESWGQIASLELSGFKTMADLLKQEFILEAKKTVRGADELAEAVAEVGEITEQEEARARYKIGRAKWLRN